MNFIILVLLAALVALGIWFWRQRSSSPKQQPRERPITIENVRPGGVLKLLRVGPDMEDFDVKVIGRHTYREDGFEWYELEGESHAGKVWLEVEEDDELEVSLSLRRLKLSEVNLSRERLEEIEQNDEGEVHFDGRTYEYEDCGEGEFLRDGDPSRCERFRYWDFEAEDGEYFLGVEAWGKEYQVHLSEALSLSQVEIYSLGEETRATERY
jgi:hypothetical protein